MTPNTDHAKRKPYVNMVQKRCHVLWAKACLKLTVSSKFDIRVVNHGRHVLRAKEEGDLPAFSSKSSISDGMGVRKCIRFGQVACFGKHYEY